jgi:DNA end-binding protein Ku
MARSIWKGSLGFGLVNVPVGVYAATQDKSIHFNQFEKGTSDRIRYKKVNERTGEEVESGNIVKGFDLGGGEYVMLSDDELAAAEPERSRQIEITDFVDLDEIDPVFYRP